MPRRSTSAWPRPHTARFASWIAPARPSAEGLRANSAWRVSMAVRAAISPPTWPPIPSATANSVRLSSARSSLTVRTRPTSVAEPDRRTVKGPPAVSSERRHAPRTGLARSPRHLEDGATHLEEVALAELGRGPDPLRVDPGPVGRPQVLHPQ